MKIWQGYASEHSANLMMIGQFKDELTATQTLKLFERLLAAAQAELQAGRLDLGSGRFTEPILKLLSDLGLNSFSPSDPEQFAYDYSIEQDGSRLILKTEELDVGAYLKLMLEGGARVEVYSAHDYPEPGTERSSTDAAS